jgi:PAS domain S-box-containing protein
MIGATQDITSRKLSEIKLLESERKLSLIARQTVSAIVITDAEEKITWINNAFTRVTEYEPEEVMGRNPGSFLQGADTDPSTVEYLNQKIKDKQAFDCEIINYSKSGRKYWMLVHGQPLLDDKGNFEQFFAIRTDITERVLLENKLVQERMTKQKEITAAVLTAQETERADIGKDLHDNLNQVLAVAKLYVQMAQTNEKNREMYLAKSCEYIVNVIEEVRKIAKKLVIPGTHIIGLFDNIKNLLKDITIIHPIKISFQAKDLVEDDLNEKMQVNIFRIVQEQVNNILKHANATMAKIILSRQGNEIVLFIGDNGDGCDLLKEKNGVGIINIKSRVELYDGIVIIISKPGKGFKLKVVLPLNAGV